MQKHKKDEKNFHGRSDYDYGIPAIRLHRICIAYRRTREQSRNMAQHCRAACYDKPVLPHRHVISHQASPRMVQRNIQKRQKKQEKQNHNDTILHLFADKYHGNCALGNRGSRYRDGNNALRTWNNPDDNIPRAYSQTHTATTQILQTSEKIMP